MTLPPSRRIISPLLILVCGGIKDGVKFSPIVWALATSMISGDHEKAVVLKTEGPAYRFCSNPAELPFPCLQWHNLRYRSIHPLQQLHFHNDLCPFFTFYSELRHNLVTSEWYSIDINEKETTKFSFINLFHKLSSF